MPKLKLGKACLIGDTWREAGEVVEVDAYAAPRYLKEGATPVGPDVEDADDPESHAAKKADAPHHKAKH